MRSIVTLPGGQKIRCHTSEECKGSICCIHSPSDHHMKEWPQHWRDDHQLMERICSHGIGHPDPDHLARLGLDQREWDSVHGCDGCCSPKEL